MSTSAGVLIKDGSDDGLYLFHNYDGYPEGIGEELKSILADIKKWDETHILKAIKKYDDGYELMNDPMGCEEYYYTIDYESHTLTCTDEDDNVEFVEHYE